MTERKYIRDVINLGISNRVLELINSPSSELVTVSIRYFGQISYGNNDDCQFILNLGIIDKLITALNDGNNFHKKEVLYCFSNIAAGLSEQSECLYRHPAYPIIIEMTNAQQIEIKVEALYIIRNNLLVCHHDLILTKTDALLKCFINSFKIKDSRVIILALQCLCCLLDAAKKKLTKAQSGYDDLLRKIIELEGVFLIEKLQEHPNQKVNELSYSILIGYFDSKEEELPKEKVNFKFIHLIAFCH